MSELGLLGKHYYHYFLPFNTDWVLFLAWSSNTALLISYETLLAQYLYVFTMFLLSSLYSKYMNFQTFKCNKYSWVPSVFQGLSTILDSKFVSARHIISSCVTADNFFESFN